MLGFEDTINVECAECGVSARRPRPGRLIRVLLVAVVFAHGAGIHGKGQLEVGAVGLLATVSWLALRQQSIKEILSFKAESFAEELIVGFGFNSADIYGHFEFIPVHANTILILLVFGAIPSSGR